MVYEIIKRKKMIDDRSVHIVVIIACSFVIANFLMTIPLDDSIVLFLKNFFFVFFWEILFLSPSNCRKETAF